MSVVVVSSEMRSKGAFDGQRTFQNYLGGVWDESPELGLVTDIVRPVLGAECECICFHFGTGRRQLSNMFDDNLAIRPVARLAHRLVREFVPIERRPAGRNGNLDVLVEKNPYYWHVVL